MSSTARVRVPQIVAMDNYYAVQAQSIDFVTDTKLSFYWTRTNSEPNYGSAPMEIFVKTLNGSTKCFRVHFNETIEDLMWMLFERENIPPQKQRLIFAGRQLEGNRTFRDYNIRDETTIHMVLNLRGC